MPRLWPFRKADPLKEFLRDAELLNEWHRKNQRERPILDRHFALLEQIKVAYRDRERSATAFQHVTALCRKSIDLAPEVASAFRRQHEAMVELERKRHKKDRKPLGPFSLPQHPGYRQLAIILEKQGDFAGAIRLSRQAKEQGWNGDWDKRITRCQGKMVK